MPNLGSLPRRRTRSSAQTRWHVALLGAQLVALLGMIAEHRTHPRRPVPTVNSCANVRIDAPTMKVAKACWFAMKTKSATELREVLDQPHNCGSFCVHRQKVRFAIR